MQANHKVCVAEPDLELLILRQSAGITGAPLHLLVLNHKALTLGAMAIISELQQLTSLPAPHPCSPYHFIKDSSVFASFKYDICLGHREMEKAGQSTKITLHNILVK